MDFEVTRRRLGQLVKLQEEVKVAKEMIKGELENNLEYVQATEEAKKTADKRKAIKEEMLSGGPNQKIVEDIKASTEEIKTIKEMLNVELFEIYKESNSDEITDSQGAVHKFEILAKVKSKKA